METSKRACSVCNVDISDSHHNCTKCEKCQEVFRHNYKLNYNRSWMKNKRKYTVPEYITRLGGAPITLEEIRNYKGGIIPNRCFRKSNEATKNEEFIDGEK